jgi:hypothetical protein
MSELPEPDYRVYRDDLNPPQSRRRMALVVASVVAVVAAGISVGLLIATSSSAEEQGASSGAELPTLQLPAGCELLTPGQVAALVPGTPTKAGRGPEVILESMESACDWANEKTDPQDPRVSPAALEVKATADIDEESARETMKISLPCQGENSRQTVVAGADEACLDHKALGNKDGPADVSTVSARFKTLVVEVSYQRRSWPAWRVDDQSAVTAAALIGRVVQSQ